MDPFCYLGFMFVFVNMLSCLFLAALKSSAGKGLAGLFALLYGIFSCVFVTNPYGVPGQVWCLVVSILILPFSYF